MKSWRESKVVTCNAQINKSTVQRINNYCLNEVNKNAMKQHTIQKAVSISGHGLHTAVQATVTLQPAPENHGYKFQRTDLEDRPIIKADVSRVVSTNRSTVLGKGDIQIGTVEHLLSALVGMGIDNVLIEIDAHEVPIMDGSARAFVEAIQEAGVEEQSEDRKFFVVEEPITFRDEETGAELLAIPSDTLKINMLPELGQSPRFK